MLFSHEFTLAVQLTCFIHKRHNVEAKLNENGFSTECQQRILDDIFGKCRGGTMFEGLVDSVDVNIYNQKLEMLEEAWSKLDADRGKVFHQWFMKYKYHIFKDTMLKPVREKPGLGSPPLQFLTNTSECVNAILKQKVEYERSELPVFIQKLKELVSHQKKEFERAVINQGNFRLRDRYKFMIIPQERWYKMSEDARKAQLQKFQQMSVIEDVLQEPCTSTSTVLPTLSVDYISVASNCTLPKSLIQNIWDKVSRLVNTKEAMAPAPGHPAEARTVESTSKTGFHLVIPGPSGKFTCDCANYNSLSLCSHAVAVTEINGRLDKFVEWHRKLKVIKCY